MKRRLALPLSCAVIAATLLCGTCLTALPAVAQEAACAPVTAVETAPPPLPVYDQPPVPGPGYIWSPGVWSWDEDRGDYYWVPGTWVEPPRVGLLWTPGYWGWFAGGYIFHPGYWGERVGFYGGINYGFGYTGLGYEGGRWDHGNFFYNRTVNNLQGARITNVYEKNIAINQTINNISYNGGRGGTEARPTAEDRTIAKEPRFAPTPLQRKQVETASQDPSLFKRANNGVPAVGATTRPGELKGPGVVAARPAGEALPPNSARPAAEEPRRPGAEPAPAESSHALPVPGKDVPARTPAQETRPAVEEKRAAPGAETRVEPRPAAESARPAVQENRPAVEQKRPEEVRREQPRPEQMARPEPAARPELRPEPAARPEARPEQMARPQAPAPHVQAAPPRPPAAAGHPAEEKRPEH